MRLSSVSYQKLKESLELSTVLEQRMPTSDASHWYSTSVHRNPQSSLKLWLWLRRRRRPCLSTMRIFTAATSGPDSPPRNSPLNIKLEFSLALPEIPRGLQTVWAGMNLTFFWRKLRSLGKSRCNVLRR